LFLKGLKENVKNRFLMSFGICEQVLNKGVEVKGLRMLLAFLFKMPKEINFILKV
jgi:hypothetical protein